VSPSEPPLEPALITKPILYRNHQIFNRELARGVSTVDSLNKIPSWNNLGRPKNPMRGTIGFNFQTNSLEIWNGSLWLKLPMKKI